MDKRIFGLRNSYSVVFSGGGQRQLPEEEAGHRLFGPVVSGGLGRSVLLRNDGQLHLDAATRPEYETPECGSAVDLVVHDKAGERILEGLLADASQRLLDEGIAGDIHVFKRGADAADSSRGCQEDYLVGRGGGFGWSDKFGLLADILIPFLFTRQLICGAGAVVQTARGAVYCLSRPARRSGAGLSSVPPRSRPFINTRDEPRAAGGFRRLRVVVGDPTMSETTTLLRAGATDLVLRMIEAGTVLPDLALDKPLRAMGEVSLDTTGRTRVRLADGRQLSALDIQREYLTRARDFADSHGADAVSRRVIGLWERALEAIEAGNLDAIAREIDWVIKYQLIERYRAERDVPLSAPEVAQADLAYHDIRRRHGLYYLAQRSGAVERTARDIDIFEAKTTSPARVRYRQAG